MNKTDIMGRHYLASNETKFRLKLIKFQVIYHQIFMKTINKINFVTFTDPKENILYIVDERISAKNNK